MQIPFNDLSRFAVDNSAALEAVAKRVILSGRYVLDKEVAAFESSFAAFVGVARAVSVNSGTDAITLALRALDVGPGDEVVTVANTATATIAAIRLTGATPIFADIDETHTMDPKDIERRCTSKTKAIVPVHLYGFPADMPPILAVARKRGVSVVEDAAQAHGATIGGKQVGNFSDAAAFSFYPTKNLGALGDGGAVITDDEALGERIRRLRVYGERERYNSVEEGVNSRLDEIQAAVLSWLLPNLSERNARRLEIAEKYLSGIKNSAVVLPTQRVGTREGVWHLFVVQVDERTRFIEHMKAQGVGTAIHYPKPVYHHEAYFFLGVDPREFPRTERMMTRIVSLPLFPELRNEEVNSVIAAVNSYEA